MPTSMQEMMSKMPQPGRVAWVGLRPARRIEMLTPTSVEAIADQGLAGDRKSEKAGGTRQVTLIMGEHIAAMEVLLGQENIDPALLRRNIVTRGVNLMALKNRRFQIGEATLELTGPCHPCSRMEENLGEGGYNAMRGHGGWCAVVLEGGTIGIGDIIQMGEIVDQAAKTAD